MRVVAWINDIRRAHARDGRIGLNARFGIDYLGYEPADIDAVLAVLPVHAHMQDAPSSHPDALLTDES